MVNSAAPSTAERTVGKTREEVISEAKRIEESLLYTSKGHFVAAQFWSLFHVMVGVPAVLLSAVAGACALSTFDPQHVYAGLLSIVVAALSSVMTFLNPNKLAASHLASGNKYDSLMNKARIFWSIDCWREQSDDVLTAQLKSLSEEKSRLNENSVQISWLAYKIARRGIKRGEGVYSVDEKQRLE